MTKPCRMLSWAISHATSSTYIEAIEPVPLCEVLERLHLEGEGFVKELATIGILESIQNVWGHTETDPEEFCRFMLPESKKWWNELNDFWAGKIPHVGAGLRND